MVKAGSEVVVKMSNSIALERIKEAEKMLDSIKPFYAGLKGYPDSRKSRLIKRGSETMVWVGGGTVITGYFLVSPILFISGILVGLLFGASYVLSKTIREYYRGYPNQKFYRKLSYIFLAKNQRSWINNYQANITAYKDAVKLYELLVAKATKELEDKGVFETLNNDESKIVSINQKSGEIQYVSREDYDQEQQLKMTSNPERVSQAILQKLTEKQELFA